jgi:D-inositol-3-phosphate glycosyltransferase
MPQDVEAERGVCMTPGFGTITRRIDATRRVWRPGAAHLAMLPAPSPLPSGLRRIEATRRVWRPGGAHLAMLPTPELSLLPLGYLDAPVPGAVLAREPFFISGWALFSTGAPSRVDLWLGDTRLGPARLGGYRPDIRGYHGDHGMISGFEHLLDLGEWDGPPGEVVLRAVATGPEGERHELPPVVAHLAPAISGDDGEAAAGAATRAPVVPARRGPVDGRRPLRVLVFTHRLDIGGAQLILEDLLRGLCASGAIDATVIASLDGELRAPLEATGVEVHLTGPFATDDPVGYAARVEELAAWSALRGFDVALVNTALVPFGGDVAASLGIPAVWAIHESYSPASLFRLMPFMHPAVRRRAEAVLRGAATAVFEARATQQLFEAHIDGRCITAPFGIDLDAIAVARECFDPVAARRERGVAEDARVIVCIGTVEPRKAQIPLVQAFSAIADLHPDTQLVIIGAGRDEYSRALEAYVAACAPPGRVRVLPVTASTWPWYGLADLMVCASDLESLPRSVMEAMAWDTPVIATSIFGLLDLVEPGTTGWLCEPRDVDAMAAALDSALSAPAEERDAIVRAARAAVAERHDVEDYVALWAQLLEDVAAAAPAVVAGGPLSESAL